MSGKICMVTGANSGIGKETALGLARMGATVIMVCRSREKGEEARQDIIHRSGNTAVELFLADLASQPSIRQLARDFQQRHQQLHVLVNNAGSFFLKRQLGPDGIEMFQAVNHLASFLLTNLLLDTIKASAPARIVNVSSVAQATGYINLDDLQMEHHYNPGRGYAQSKLENVLFTYALARRLEGTGVTANCLHPGTVATNIWSSPLPSFLRGLSVVSRLFGVSPEEGAHTSLYLASSPEVEGVTGKYFKKFAAQPSASISYDVNVQERLWQISAELTGVPVNS